MDGSGGLRPSHFGEDLPEGDHFFCYKEEAAEFCFGCWGHNVFNDGSYGKNRAVVGWHGDVFGEHDVDADAAYLNVSKARSRAGAYIMLSEDVLVLAYNGPVLTIANIIKNVMSSTAEAELGGLFLIAKEMIPLRPSLTEMGWPQPPTPIQCDNSTTVGVANKTIIYRKTKSMDMNFHWLRCR